MCCFLVYFPLEIGDTLLVRPEFCALACHNHKAHRICVQTRPGSLLGSNFTLEDQAIIT